MKVVDYIKAYMPFALKTEEKTGISAVFILAQSALESGWGKSAPNNMFFGIKDTDGVNGNEQLVRTFEYSSRSDLKFPVINSITPVTINNRKMFKYDVKTYFRKYETPEESFTDHAKFFFQNSRYAKALEVKEHPYVFAKKVAEAGYATGPKYYEVLVGVMDLINGVKTTSVLSEKIDTVVTSDIKVTESKSEKFKYLDLKLQKNTDTEMYHSRLAIANQVHNFVMSCREEKFTIRIEKIIEK